MVYTRGSNDDYDRWARLTSDEGWEWENVSQFYFKVTGQSSYGFLTLTRAQSSRIVPPADGHNTTSQFIPADHGDGPIEISLPNFPNIINNPVIATAKASTEFSFNVDLQSGNSTGICMWWRAHNTFVSCLLIMKLASFDPIYYRWRTAQ